MTTTGITIHDQNLEKQIEKHMGGCMAGFFNLFDRNHLLSGKRLYPKRLPPPAISSTAGDSASESVSIVGSPTLSMEFEKPKPQPEVRSTTPVSEPAKTNSPSETTKSPWKFNREAPRLSLDSRAITDGKGGLRPREIRINTVSSSAAAADDGKENQRQSPSVIARLMGLEQLPSSSSEPEKKVELRRSASESRSRDYRFFDTPSFLSPVTTKNDVVGERKSDQISGINRNQSNNHIHHGIKSNNVHKVKNQSVVHNNSNNQRRLMVERKSYYDTADFFPPEVPVKQQQQQHQAAVSIYGEIGRRMRMRGVDEPLKDLETLKHILEALQLKGLLHSSTATTTKSRHNRRFSSEEESPVVLMRPARSPSNNRRRNANNASSGESPKRERPARSPMRSPGRGDNRSSSPTIRRKGGPLSVETQRKTNETTTTSTRGSQHSPVQSPKMTTTRRSDQTVNRSPRNRRSTVEICQGDRVLSGPPAYAEDEASTTISESSFSTSSHTDNERWRGEEYRDGRNLLERCDKLLNSIAEITAKSNSNSNSAELQQSSPVSVLDSSFYKEDESSPSPVKKRTIDFKDQVVMELEDELLWSPSSIIQLSSKLDHDIDSSDDSEFSYVTEVLRASNYLPDENNLFMLLEKQSSISKNKSKTSILQRKLIFDTITEILDRNRQLPPWKTVSNPNSATGSEQIWSEFQKIQERGPSEDLFEVICGVLKKDLAEDSVNGWADSPVEMSEAVLDIERLIFKDLIGETIRDLATTTAGQSVDYLRRKLVF
ncbi:hypothetical protein SOVF_160280 [Spinacia oleracea]|uniref:Protein LONGIFOLIA 2 n=1 Tax=Spinacia oleracea TaxID=3562 RepID=A0ABM3QKX8_SPIOL|nr:protein LONGIFOLIA 2 [Spinacia oleracea]KNA08700.1 hypothetical protein SOVF_160280 [Spinacia oleracea]